MLKKAAALFLVCASMAICLSCGVTSGRFLYAAIPGVNQMVVFREDPNSGVLTGLAGSPITAGAAVQSIVIHPSRKFLYAANTGDSPGDVSLFTIAPGGGLSEVTPRTPVGTAPTVLAMDAAGTFLYVGNSGSSNISVFSVNASDRRADSGDRLSLPDRIEPHQYCGDAIGHISVCDGHGNAWIHRGLQSESGHSERSPGLTVLYGRRGLTGWSLPLAEAFST